jgi:hypothetical protein
MVSLEEQYVEIEGFLAKVAPEDAEEYVVGDAYDDGEGTLYLFLGSYEENSRDGERPGIYEHEGEPVCIEYPEGERITAEMAVSMTMSHGEAVLNTAKKNKALKGVRQPKAESTRYEDNSNSEEISQSSFLYYEPKEDDPPVIALLKETINAARITYKDVYRHFNKTKGYNLIYGLRERSKITLESIENWAIVLDVELRCSFVQREEQ